jgi:hypothetical protein
VTVLQFIEGLSDRGAADAVRGRIDWKYLLCLELDDPGFDHSVLCEFRTRLLEGGAELIVSFRRAVLIFIMSLSRPARRKLTNLLGNSAIYRVIDIKSEWPNAEPSTTIRGSVMRSHRPTTNS